MLQESIAQLKRSGESIAALVRGLDRDDARWRPGEGKWSIVEVMAHLVDEERDDFRTRIDLTLRHPERDWPSIDPEGWAVTRNYASKEIEQVADEFCREREASLVWLKSLGSPDWNVVHKHPRIGPMTAGTLLGSWVAHDLLHLRQIARIRYARMSALFAPHSLEYAGPAPE